jgi:hypothetical protein
VRFGEIGEGLIETIETLDLPAAPALALGQYVLVAALLAAAAGAAVASQPPRARLGPAPTYLVNWSSPREAIYEDAGGSARRMAAGDNVETVDDVFGAKALVKRLDKAVPGRAQPESGASPSSRSTAFSKSVLFKRALL